MEESSDSILTPLEPMPVPVNSSLALNEDVPSAEGDNIQCTFFRQPKEKSTLLNESYTAFTSSDSEIEFEESNVRSSEEVSINSDTTYNELDFHHDDKEFDSPKTKFDYTESTDSDSYTKLQPGKHSTKPNSSPANSIEVIGDRSNAKSNKLNNKSYNKEEKMLLVKCVNNNRYNHVFSDVRCVVYGSKRSYDVVSQNGTTIKRKGTYENKIIKYKRLLKSVETVIHKLSEQDSIKPRNKVGETNLVKKVSFKDQCPSSESLVVHPKMDKVEPMCPIFNKPELEKFLNDSMHRAVKMYRICRNTWDNVNIQAS